MTSITSLSGIQRQLQLLRALAHPERVILVKVPKGTPYTEDHRQQLLEQKCRSERLEITPQDTVIFINEDGKGSRAD